MNTFGNIFRLTSFGESHGPGIGGVIDGCPSGFELDMDVEPTAEEIAEAEKMRAFRNAHLKQKFI